MSTSTKRTVLQSVVVKRDGKSYVPPLHEVFEFTAEELKDIERINPDAVSSQAMVSVDDAPAKPAPGHMVKRHMKDEGAL